MKATPDKLPRPARLVGKSAVVTGASRGIGLAIADALENEGCFVFAAFRTISGKSRPPKTDHRKLLPCDVRRERSVARLFAEVKRRLPRLDFLINNAGIAHPLHHIENMPFDIWRDVLDTNLTGMFLCTRAALPMMGRGGVIVNNLSVAARAVFPGESAYCASKYGALGLTETLREELRSRGIRVLSLLPGPTATGIWDQFMPEAPRNKMMSPDTVARVVVETLCLPENSSVEEIRMGPTEGNL